MDIEFTNKGSRKCLPGQPIFSIAECQKLDRLVRGSGPLTTLPALTNDQLRELQLSLRAIGSLYDADGQINVIKTSIDRKKHFNDVKRKALALLKCFDIDRDDNLDRINLALFTEKHVFHGIEIDGLDLIKSLKILCDVCERMDEEELGNPEPGRKPDGRFHLLIGRLGFEYAVFWGRGVTPASTNDGAQGGPSVRFMHAAAEMITCKKMTQKKVFDAYRAAQTTVPELLSTWEQTRRRKF